MYLFVYVSVVLTYMYMYVHAYINPLRDVYSMQCTHTYHTEEKGGEEIGF